MGAKLVSVGPPWRWRCHLVLKLLGVIIIHASIVTLSSAEEYKKSEDSCAIYDSCQARGFFRTCSCDEDCYRYGTCCFDAAGFASMGDGQELFQCYADRIPLPVFAKSSCSMDFNGDRTIKTSCENATANVDDLMGNVLVSSNSSLTTYRNWNCAICNHEIASNLEFWTIQATCFLHTVKESLETDFIRQNIAYNAEENEWGVFQTEEFIRCPTTYFEPASSAGKLRQCATNMVSDCPAGWKDNIARINCLSYHGERKLKKSNVYYRNVHCAICNGVDLTELECYGRNYRSVYPRGNGNAVRVGFNLNPWSAGYSEGGNSCSQRQRYDPFWRMCRNIERGLVHPLDEINGAGVLGSILYLIILNILFVHTLYYKNRAL